MVARTRWILLIAGWILFSISLFLPAGPDFGTGHVTMIEVYAWCASMLASVAMNVKHESGSNTAVEVCVIVLPLFAATLYLIAAPIGLLAKGHFAGRAIRLLCPLSLGGWSLVILCLVVRTTFSLPGPTLAALGLTLPGLALIPTRRRKREPGFDVLAGTSA